jgi:hypothetical protein
MISAIQMADAISYDLHTSQIPERQDIFKHLRQGKPVDCKLPTKFPSLSPTESNQYRIVISSFILRQVSPNARIVSESTIPHASDHIPWHGRHVSRSDVVDGMLWEVTPGVDSNDLQRMMKSSCRFVQHDGQPVPRINPIVSSPELGCSRTMHALILLGSSDLVIHRATDEPNARGVRGLHYQAQSLLTCHVRVYTNVVAHETVARPLVVGFRPRLSPRSTRPQQVLEYGLFVR